MKRYIAAILIPCLLLQLWGCYSPKYLAKYEFLSEEKDDIQITTFDNEVYSLINNRYTVRNDTVFLINGPIYYYPYKLDYIPMNDIRKYEKQEFNATMTIGLVVSCAVIGGLILLSLLNADVHPSLGSWN